MFGLFRHLLWIGESRARIIAVYIYMFEFFKKQGNFVKLEFWAFTALFAFVLLFFIMGWNNGDDMFATDPYKYYFEQANIPYSYYGNYFFPRLVYYCTLFLLFMSLNFLIIPKLVKKQAVVKNLFWGVTIFLVAGGILLCANLLLHEYLFTTKTHEGAISIIISLSYQDALQMCFILLFYTLIKYAGLYSLSIVDAIHQRFRFITREAIIATFLWLIVLLLMIAARAERELIMGWCVIIPYGIVFYSYAFQKLIPQMLTRKRPLLSYALRSAWVIALLFLPVFLFLMAWTGMPDATAGVCMLNVVFQLFVTVPVAWLLYKRKQKGNEEVTVLQKELKQSTANIDFLRSQINPHFIFNSLNSIRALVDENPERARRAITELSNILRSSMQADKSESVPLQKELNIVKDYLALENMRFEDRLRIEYDIDESTLALPVPPMMLQTLVENAIKHGISKQIQGGVVRIVSVIRDNFHELSVQNTGYLNGSVTSEPHQLIGRRPSGSVDDLLERGFGLSSTTNRLSLLYGNKAKFEIKQTAPSLVEARVQIPVELADY